MRKTALILFLSFCLLSGFKEYILAYSPHYLPGGDNYLSEDNFVMDGDYYRSDPFLVKPYTEYILTIPREYYENETPTTIVEFYQNEALDDSYVCGENEYAIYMETNYFFITFMTGSNINYLTVQFYGGSGFFSTPSLVGFMLEEGLVYDGYEPYIEGSMIDTTAPYFQSAGTVISYVDTPITAAEIQSALRAYDAIDGDVSTSISVITDNYTAFSSILGSYTILFSVEDLSDNSTEIEVVVQVVDAVDPIFTDIGIVTAVYPNALTIPDVMAMLTASDNYDGDISAQIELIEDRYSASSQITGNYEIDFSVSDSSGNTRAYTVMIEVVDDEAPVFSGTTAILIGYDAYISPDLVKSGLTVIDNYDVPASLSIVLYSDDYSAYHNVLGEYTMVFEVYDSSLNRKTQTVTLSVVDEIGPVVYFDCAIIQVYNDTVLSLGDVTTLLSRSKEIDNEKDYKVMVVYDSYSRHSSTPGVYHLSLDLEDESGKVLSKTLQIRVKEKPVDYVYESPDIGDVPTLSFWDKYRWYISMGAMGGVVLASNGIWFILMKKKKAF